jgi:hypothetical protein
MKLYEAIKDMPDNEWLDISEIKRGKPVHVGRITKELLKGEILSREVVTYLSAVGSAKHRHSIPRFYVETRKNEIFKFE